MNSNRHSRLLLLLVIMLGLCSLSLAQAQGDHFHWSGKLAPNQVVQIKDINGSIDAEGSNGDTIDISAEKGGPDRDQVRVELVQTGDGITVCAVYPGSSCSGDSNSHSHGDIHARVDFRVTLPRNLRFRGYNVNGNVNAQNMGRPAKASTVNGSVDVSSSSYVEAVSVNGAIKVSMGSSDWEGRLKISSVNGSVTLYMPEDLNAEVHFSSVNGNLSTDFPLTVQGNVGFGHGPKNMRGTIGNGGRELDVSTVNGSLSINKGRAAM
ncbi:MAG: DUF4097 family beta strand repeat-containing protein [Terriglobales bacterium]